MRSALLLTALVVLGGCNGLGLWSAPRDRGSTGTSAGSGSGAGSTSSGSSTGSGTSGTNGTASGSTTTGTSTSGTSTSSTSTGGTTGVVTGADVTPVGDLGSAGLSGAPYDVAAGSDGTLYASDLGDDALVSFSGGQGQLIAGGNGKGHQDGAGGQAVLASPYGLALVGTTLYFMDEGDGSGSYAYLRSYDTASHQVSTLCGSGVSNQYQGGACALASFDTARGITYFGNAIYVADSGAHRVLKIDLGSQQVSSWAGSSVSGDVDANGPSAQFSDPMDVAADAQGDLYVADYTNVKIRKIDPARNVTTFATLPAGAAPFGVAVDAQGNVYASDENQGRIFRWTPDGILTAEISDPNLENPAGLSFDAAGNLLVANVGGSDVLLVSIP